MEDQTNVVYLDQYRQRKLSEQFDRVEAMKRQHPSYKPKKEEEKDSSDIQYNVLVKQILLRILAVFAASGLSVVGAGAIAGVNLWKAVLMAGVGGVATVIEGLARAYMDDGKIDADEINDVFNKVDKGAKKQ